MNSLQDIFDYHCVLQGWEPRVQPGHLPPSCHASLEPGPPPSPLPTLLLQAHTAPPWPGVQGWGASARRVQRCGISSGRIQGWGASSWRVHRWGTSAWRVQRSGASAWRVQRWGTSAWRVQRSGASAWRVQRWGTSAWRVQRSGASSWRVQKSGDSGCRVQGCGTSGRVYSLAVR